MQETSMLIQNGKLHLNLSALQYLIPIIAVISVLYLYFLVLNLTTFSIPDPHSKEVKKFDTIIPASSQWLDKEIVHIDKYYIASKPMVLGALYSYLNSETLLWVAQPKQGNPVYYLSNLNGDNFKRVDSDMAKTEYAKIIKQWEIEETKKKETEQFKKLIQD